MTEPIPSDPHKPADDTEQVYFDGPPSLVSALGQLIPVTLLALAIAIVPFFISALPAWACAVGVLAALVIIAIPIVLLRTHRYRISNYRIDYEHGLLWKKIDTLELWHVDDITFSQSPIDRIFKLGTITVESHDTTTPRLRLDGLPNARPTFDTLKQRIISVKRQRGVIKMDVG